MSKLNKKLVIIGAGGHAKVCYDIAQRMNKWEEIIFLADNSKNDYFKISGSISEFEEYIGTSDFFVAIGENKIREKITNKLLDKNVTMATLIHPQTIIAPDVKIEMGTVIMAGVVINSTTKVGEGSIINTSSSIDHDNIIGEYVHISPGGRLAGSISIGDRTWLGINTTIINNISIVSDTLIGAGAVVISDINEVGTYYGIPARMKNNE